MARANGYDNRYKGDGKTRTRGRTSDPTGEGKRETEFQKKCFVKNPDGTVYCIGWSYGDEPECFCRVYPGMGARKDLLSGVSVIYNQEGFPVRTVKTEEGEIIVDIPRSITQDIPVVDPLPPEVVSSGQGVAVKDPVTGEVTIQPVKGSMLPGGTVAIMGRNYPVLGVAAVGLVALRVFKII